MRKSPDNAPIANSKTRKLISYLFAGLMVFAQASDTNIKQNPDSTAENKSSDKSGENIFKGIKIVPDSKPKKNGKKKEENIDIENCGDCQLG